MHAAGKEPLRRGRTFESPRPGNEEIMFGRLADWRRIAIWYDRCAATFGAITLDAIVTFWLGE